MIFELNQKGTARMLEVEESQELAPLRKSQQRNGTSNTQASETRSSFFLRIGKGLLFLFIGFLIGTLITSDMASVIRFWESGGAATLAPSPPPTPQPTFQPTANPTPAPIQTAKPTIVDDKVEKGEKGEVTYQAQPQMVRPDPPLTPERSQQLADEWGKWEFTDVKERPKETEFATLFPNKDVPRDQFPPNAWQTDREYLDKWLDESLKLVDRSMEAILSEYGFGKKDLPNDDFDTRSEIFRLRFIDFNKDSPPRRKEDYPGDGGYTTERSFRGLVRRVLHALMVRDTFTLVVGGHSAAAGHGNYFQQSYAMQFHKVMEPIFGLLGVELRTHNFSQGGLGTLQAALGSRSIYGDEIDILIWDTSMIEGADDRAQDLFYRQAILGGNRVPFIFGGRWVQLKTFHESGEADVGQFGSGMNKIPECTDEVQAETIPYAARFMKCSGERRDMCNNHKFLGNCWVERPDVVPPTKQDAEPGSRVAWHPGFRWHQLVGRSIAFTVLRALKLGLQKWKGAEHLNDEDWHVTAHYKNIQNKVQNFSPDHPCEQGFKGNGFPEAFALRVCSTPLWARTEFTPRANPDKTSLRSIIKPNELGYVPHISEHLLYTGPNVHNPLLDLPEGAIDVVAIVSNGRSYPESRRLQQEPIVPGLGWQMNKYAHTGYCDGTYNSECSRDASNTCLYLGHNDGRAGLIFDSYSGWLVMRLPAVKEGLIITKIETWLQPSDIFITNGWKSIDNKGRRNLLRIKDTDSSKSSQNHFDDSSARSLRRKKPPPQTCDQFKFDIAIDGKVTTWDKSEWEKQNIESQRVVELQVLLNDPNFTSEAKDVELAIRMRGCGDSSRKTMQLTHIYFA
jgi:hypothetical protein